MPQRGKLKSEDSYAIRQNWKYLLDQLTADSFNDEFFEKDIFSEDDIDELDSEKVRKEKTRMMLKKLLNAGPNAYGIFMKVLDEVYPFVAEKLKETKRTAPSTDESQSQWDWFDHLPQTTKSLLVDQRVACRIAQCVGENWRPFFVQLLNYSVSKVKEEERRCCEDSTLTITSLLTKWHQISGANATVENLVKEMKSFELYVDGQEMQKRLAQETK